MTTETKKPNPLKIFAFLLMAIGSLAVEVYTVNLFVAALRVASWPTTNGTILRSELKSEFTGVKQYTADIEYQFEVNGESYTSSRVRTRGASNKHRTDIEAVVDKYRPGSVAVVYYNQSRPEESYLEAGVDFVNFIMIVSPLCFAFLFGSVFVEAWRERHRTQSHDAPRE